MKNLIKKLKSENRIKITEFKKDLNSLERIEITCKCNSIAFYRSLFTPAKFKNVGAMTKKDLVAYMVQRFEAKKQKQLDKDIDHIEFVNESKAIKKVTISVEWTKSATWGNNPKATAQVNYTDNTRETFASGSVGGCAFDKESQAVADALNQSDSLLKYLYQLKNKDVTKSNRDLIGYGSVYGLLPRFEGGVGVSCMNRIFESIGFRFETVSSGKSFTVYQIIEDGKNK